MPALAKSPEDRYPTAAELERALAACAAADEWSADRAQAWWKLRGAAPPPAHPPGHPAAGRENDGGGRTVEIDPGARQ